MLYTSRHAGMTLPLVIISTFFWEKSRSGSFIQAKRWEWIHFWELEKSL